MDEPWDVKMREFLRAHAGIVSIAKLAEYGCTHRDAYRLAASDEFELVLPGVLRSTHWPLGTDQLLYAACLRNPRAVVNLLSAAQIWRFRGLPRIDEAFVLVPHSSSPEMRGLIVQRCRRIDPVDIVHRDDGLRVTSPTRTLFDCADRLGATATASILEQLINEGRGSFVTHAATISRLGHSRRPGTRTMAAVIGSRPAWRRAMQSALETRVLAEIERQGLPTPVVQLSYPLPSGGTIRLDFAWPAHKVALEVDHPFWHAGAEESRRDKRRDLKMSTVGWQTLRITDLDVTVELAASIRDVGVVLASR